MAYLKSGSPITTQGQFCTFFKCKAARSLKAILRFTKKKKLVQGSVAEKRSGRGCTAVTPEEVRLVAEKAKESLNASVKETYVKETVKRNQCKLILFHLSDPEALSYPKGI